MTSPAITTDRAVDLDATPTSPVLQRRALHPDAELANLPVFGDPRWDLSAGMPDRHTGRETIHWDRYPAPFRHACKLYVFALVNVTDGAPRLARARSEIPAIKTILRDLPFLQVFLRWLVDRSLGSFAEVTTADLDDYYRHITDQPATSLNWKRRALNAVQRLHAYRDFLPSHSRLPGRASGGGASTWQLVEDHAPKLGENRTQRIHPEVMQPLLSAALLVTDAIAADLQPAAGRLIAMRRLADRVAPDLRRQTRGPGTSRWKATIQQLERLLAGLAEDGQALPGVRAGRTTAIDTIGLAVGGWLDRDLITRTRAARAMLADCNLPVTANLLRVTRFTRFGPRPWRDRTIDAADLVRMLRQVVTACFLVIAYLSGVRTGEALNLRRGCISHDRKLGLTFLSGQQMKTTDQHRERSPATIPWVVTEQVAHAVAVLEQLAVGSMLLPFGEICAQGWFRHASSRSRTPTSINRDIAEFITWFNTEIVPATGHPRIGEDPHGKIVVSRLRRTLAWHIVRRPGGTIAAATQYGHLHTQLVQGYAGRADSGFLDEITFEEFLLRAETIHDDHQRLTQGEHVSGPAADAYRGRVAAGTRFAGLTITSPAQAHEALANPDLQIHHGALLTCVYRPATAACRDQHDTTDGGPAWPRCRLTCNNITRTDRDITALRQHVHELTSDLAADGLPEPLHRRIQQRLDEHVRAIAEHDTSRAHQPNRPGPGPESSA
jgi:integrase